MKTLIIIITLCGKPDAVLIREVGVEPVYMDWRIILNSEENSKRFIELIDDSEKMVIDHTNGTCV